MQHNAEVGPPTADYETVKHNPIKKHVLDSTCFIFRFNKWSIMVSTPLSWAKTDNRKQL